MRAFEDIKYGESADPCKLIDFYLPDGECSVLFLFFHGGGFVEGSRKDLHAHHPFVTDMLAEGFGVASAEYRMYPEAHFPEFIEDAAEAISFVKRELAKHHFSGKLVVGGCSAGGHITQMLCFNDAFLSAVGLSNSDIDAYVHDAGQPTVHFNVLKEYGLDTRRVIVDERAPLYHVGKAESYPPMQIIVSDCDIENRLEETELLVGTMKHFGIHQSKIQLVKTHGTHVWYVNAVDENQKSEYAKIITPFIKSVI